MNTRKAGFTLVEVLVASTIGAFIALVAVGALRAITYSSEMTYTNIDSASEVMFAKNMIARDLMNLYRNKDINSTKLVGKIEESGQRSTCIITLYTISRTKARFQQPEGDVYEVEYFVLEDNEKSTFFRRFWPNPDKDIEPGGILTAIADNIDIFNVRFFDGQEWSDEWPEEMETLPELVEVNIGTKPSNQAESIIESFIVNLTRYPQNRTGATRGGVGNEDMSVEGG